MGTRGLWGFFKDGVTKATYNHYDSYPSALGVTIADFVKAHPVIEMEAIFNNIQMIDSEKAPTSEDIIKYSKFYDGRVNGGSVEDFYALLRESQGDPEAYGSGELDIMIDSISFIQDSLFCEWAYIINLDDKCLEVYKGFRHTPPKNSRYYDKDISTKREYYPCDIIKSIPFDEVTELNVASLEKEEDE